MANKIVRLSWVALIVLGLCAALIHIVLCTQDRCSHVEVIAKTEVVTLSSALEQYVLDEGAFPGEGAEAGPGSNQFPLLFNALFGARAPAGTGGRSAPYTSLKSFRVAVRDLARAQFIPATEESIRDARIDKFILDPWGDPYVYRANKGRTAASVMKNREAADIYSCGQDGVDDTVLGIKDSDDIGNW